MADSPAAVIVFYTISWTNLLAAMLFRLLGRTVVCLVPLTGRAGHVAALLGIQEANFTAMQNVDAYGFLRFRHSLALAIVDDLFPNRALIAFSAQYTNLPNAEAKLHTALYTLAARFADKGARLLAACHAFQVNGIHAEAFAVLDPYTALAWKSVSGASNKCPAAMWWGRNVGLVFRHVALRMVTLVHSKLQALCARDAEGTCQQRVEQKPKERVFAEPDSSEVLFFPHQGVGFGALFKKDHFYVENPESPLHSSNILHVELAGRMAPAVLEGVLDDCEEWNLPVRLLARSGSVVSHLRSFALFSLKGGRIRTLPRMLRGLMLAFGVWYQYAGWRKGLAPYTKAKLALVGYDYLFPPTLAMALQSKNISVAAVQERFIQAFYPNLALILNDYYVCGDIVQEAVENNPLCVIDRVHVTGNVRNDLLKAHVVEKSHETKTVVVFDFHSNPHEKGSLKNPVINWVANRAFYEDLVRLAPLFPSVRFIIRGKDAQWLDIPYFQKVRDAVLGMDNIIVDQDYSVLNRSYLLAAEADVIIARHTSIGDELLAAGTPVIFHDYTPNCSGIVSSVFDYEEFPLFVHDFGQLKHRLEQALDGEYMDDATWDRLQSRYYANSFDGCVRERIQAGVKALLKDKASGARQ